MLALIFGEEDVVLVADDCVATNEDLSCDEVIVDELGLIVKVEEGEMVVVLVVLVVDVSAEVEEVLSSG